jgi:hypothetical protein
MNKHDIERMARAWQEVTENRFVIPEEIPANERTAFHGAAAAAAKAGKTSFSFAGKTHPVTMKKDTATKIADQKEGVTEGLLDKIKSMTPAAKAAKKAAADKKAMDDMGNSIMSLATAKKGKPKSESSHEDQKEETEVNELKTSTYKSYMKKSEKDDEKAFEKGDYNRSVKRGVGQAMAADALKRKAAKKRRYGW